MKIWLIDFDGKIENLALMRLSTYYKKQDAIVELKHGNAIPELWDRPDKVFISCVFSWNKDKALNLECQWQPYADVEIGGSGVDISKKLPSEIQACEKDYSLYGKNRAIGFISRGCIRSCPWCIVHQKEGKLRRVATAEQVVNGYREAIFLDNNFLALPDCKSDLEWLIQNKTKIDFNQGLDARLVTDEIADLLAMCKWSNYIRFSLDTNSQKKDIEHVVTMLVNKGIKADNICVFMLIGHSGFESDYERLIYARELGVKPRPMRYIDRNGVKQHNGWSLDLWKMYPRLIWRYYWSDSVWQNFERDSRPYL